MYRDTSNMAGTLGMPGCCARVSRRVLKLELCPTTKVIYKITIIITKILYRFLNSAQVKNEFFFFHLHVYPHTVFTLTQMEYTNQFKSCASCS